MLKNLLLYGAILVSAPVFSQKLEQANWQQRVNYTINVSLDDVNNILRGYEVMQYTNNSPDALKEIYMHLWPNGYKNNETAFAKQLFENGNSSFNDAAEDMRGGIDSLNFMVNGTAVKWELTENIDVAKLTLNQPLASGSTISIATPFKVQMPGQVFSRMGAEEQLYCVTQWYPKPAVYDVNGWNPMPYLDQGEFYSEFGRFDVQITIPENYVVAATGVLQNEDEKRWLRSKMKHPDPEVFVATNGEKLEMYPETPPSSPNTKTLRFVQDSIHDFAWFASKRFLIDTGSTILPNSGRRVETWFYHIKTTGHENGVKDIDTALLFYSKMLGDYPYSSASVVITPLVAGSGMEYPMITNMTSANKQVIVHEVGHNWFYGILGSNEREYPWMDESINNYYETRCSENEEMKKPLSVTLKNLGSLKREGYIGLEWRYLTGARKNDDQAAFLPSVAYTDHNYGAIIYGKASSAFHYLQRYLGDDRFDAMMRAYYEKWKFKHPLPNDFINHAKQFTGKDLNWFFDGVMSTTYKQDWKIAGVKKTEKGYELKVKNKSPINGPFSVTGLNNNVAVTTVWYDSTGSGKVIFPTGTYDNIRIDAYENTIDAYRSNNTIKTKGLFKKCEPLQLRLFGDVENAYKTQVFFTPIAGANLYNKMMVGAAFYNSLYPTSKVEYIIAPMYAFGTKDLAGSAEVQHHFLSYGFAKKITVGFRTSRYASEYFVPTTYEKLEPSIRFELAKARPRTDADQYILARYVLINEQNRGAGYYTNLDKAFGYAVLDYVIDKKRLVNPYNAKFHYELGNANSMFQKLSAEATQFFNYEKPKKGFTVRVFGGVFVQKPSSADDRAYYRAGGNTGQFDYLFDQSQFGRGENSLVSNSLFTRQLMPGGAQFSSPTLLSGTDSWLTSINLNTTIPGIIPIKLYADGALVNERISEVNGNTGETEVSYDLQFYYTAGLRVVLFNELLQVNFPIVASSQINDVWKGNNGGDPVNYAQRISFTFDLNRMNPIRKIREGI